MKRTARALVQATPRAPLSSAVGHHSLHSAAQEIAKLRAESVPSSSATVIFAKRHTIFGEHEPADTLYQVVTGAVVLTRAVSSGRRQVLEVVGPGGIVGAVPGTHYSCRAETMSRTVLRRIDRSTAETSVTLQRVIGQALMHKLEKLHDETNMRTRRSAAECVAALILSLPKAEENSQVGAGAGTDRRIALTQSDMASYLGLAIATVCRIMRDLKQMGAIRMSGRECIAILDRQALARLAAAENAGGCVA
jgi:CRP-like cAMP-binding protein